jgi:hypothetical protein
MDVTPSPGMYRAMEAFVSSTIGEAPLKSETTTAANNRRQARRVAMDFLHDLVRLSMREGVARDRRERGMPTVQDDVQPNKLAREVNQAMNSNVLHMPTR